MSTSANKPVVRLSQKSKIGNIEVLDLHHPEPTMRTEYLELGERIFKCVFNTLWLHPYADLLLVSYHVSNDSKRLYMKWELLIKEPFVEENTDGKVTYVEVKVEGFYNIATRMDNGWIPSAISGRGKDSETFQAVFDEFLSKVRSRLKDGEHRRKHHLAELQKFVDVIGALS
jgi:hypothetical protein